MPKTAIILAKLKETMAFSLLNSLQKLLSPPSNISSNSIPLPSSKQKIPRREPYIILDMNECDVLFKE